MVGEFIPWKLVNAVNQPLLPYPVKHLCHWVGLRYWENFLQSSPVDSNEQPQLRSPSQVLAPHGRSGLISWGTLPLPQIPSVQLHRTICSGASMSRYFLLPCFYSLTHCCAWNVHCFLVCLPSTSRFFRTPLSILPYRRPFPVPFLPPPPKPPLCLCGLYIFPSRFLQNFVALSHYICLDM